MAHIQIVRINDVSDGDSKHRPSDAWTVVDPPTIYLEKLASQWLEARGEQVLKGMLALSGVNSLEAISRHKATTTLLLFSNRS